MTHRTLISVPCDVATGDAFPPNTPQTASDSFTTPAGPLPRASRRAGNTICAAAPVHSTRFSHPQPQPRNHARAHAALRLPRLPVPLPPRPCSLRVLIAVGAKRRRSRLQAAQAPPFLTIHFPASVFQFSVCSCQFVAHMWSAFLQALTSRLCQSVKHTKRAAAAPARARAVHAKHFWRLGNSRARATVCCSCVQVTKHWVPRFTK